MAKTSPFLTLLLLATVSQPAASQAIRGTVRDSSNHRGIPNAQITLLNEAGETATVAVSKSDGTFLANAPTFGVYTVSVIRIGYQPLQDDPLMLFPGDTVEAVYSLAPLPVPLEPVIVETQAVHIEYLQEEGFFYREKAYQGRFLDPAAIDRRREFARRADDFLIGQAMVMSLDSTRRGYRLRCGRPRLFIDDREFYGDDFDQAIDPEDVLAIEIYDVMNAMPFSVFYGKCAVAVWTRSAAEAKARREPIR
jgi:hypothetical protein